MSDSNSPQPQHSATCPCCNPALTLLAEAFTMPRRMFLLGAGSFVTAVALGNKAEAMPPQVHQHPQLAQLGRLSAF